MDSRRTRMTPLLVLVLVVTAGCIAGSPSTSTPATTPTEHSPTQTTTPTPVDRYRSVDFSVRVFHGRAGTVFDTGINVSGPPSTWDDQQAVLVIRSESELATKYNESFVSDYKESNQMAAIDRYVSETNFSTSYLIVYQEFPVSSRPSTNISQVTYNPAQNRTVLVRNPSPTSPRTTDLVLETVLIRVHGPPPETVGFE